MGGSQEELPHVRGQGQRPRVPDCDGAGTAEKELLYVHGHRGGGREEIPSVRGQGRRAGGTTPHPHAGGQGRRAGGATHAQGQELRREELPASEDMGSSQEKLPHAPKPEAKGGGGEEQPHIQGAVAARAQEGLEELSHIGRVAVRKYPSSKVRSNGYALLEQP